MKQTVNLNTFQDAFKAIRPANFSYAGLEALFEYLEAYEQDTGEEMELDVIALCCDFSEYASAQEATEGHGWASEPFECPECLTVTYSNQKQCEEDDCRHLATEEDLEAWKEEQEEAALEYLQDHTTVISFDSGVIIQAY